MLMTLNYKYKISHHITLDQETWSPPQYNNVRKCEIFSIGSSLLEFLKNEKERSLIIEKNLETNNKPSKKGKKLIDVLRTLI